MTKYIRADIQRTFDYLKISNDALAKTASKQNEKGNTEYADKLYEAKVKIVEAIELLAEANNIKLHTKVNIGS